jgi:restriction endonuclease Mrr
MKQEIKLSHIESIMLMLDKLSKNDKRSIGYEDLVVAMYKDRPGEFHLKGYPQYPDSEPIGKRLYDAKHRGLVRISKNKMVNITDLGNRMIEELKSAVKGKSIRSNKKVSRLTEKELKRITSLQGFQLYSSNSEGEILDTDFYAYLGVSVRTEKTLFQSQVKLLTEVLKEITKTENSPGSEIYNQVINYHAFLFKKFDSDLKFKQIT